MAAVAEVASVSVSTVASLASLVSDRAPGAIRRASGLGEATEDAVGRTLPVRAELAALLPQRGLRRGSTVVVRGSTTVLLALLAAATAHGAWAAVVGMPDLGLVAAAELGVAVHRLALVPRPGAEFGAVVAALLDGVDLVAVAPDARVDRTALARRLSARARHRGSVLLPIGSWPTADLEITGGESTWSGVAQDGSGHLTGRILNVTVRGRGAAVRPARGQIHLPTPPGKATSRPQAPRPAEPPHPTHPERLVDSRELKSVPANVTAEPTQAAQPTQDPRSHRATERARATQPTQPAQPTQATQPSPTAQRDQAQRDRAAIDAEIDWAEAAAVESEWSECGWAEQVWSTSDGSPGAPSSDASDWNTSDQDASNQDASGRGTSGRGVSRPTAQSAEAVDQVRGHLHVMAGASR